MENREALGRVHRITPVPATANATVVASEVKAKLVTLGVDGKESRVDHEVTGKE